MQLSEHLQNLFSANADINTKIIIMQSTSLSSSAEARSKLQKGKMKMFLSDENDEANYCKETKQNMMISLAN